MRFDALLFPAYGPFTDLSLDVSQGQFGLHLLYGPNEAGKSSSLKGLREFLRGVHTQTRANFIHPYGDLKIGARMRRGETTSVFFRKKKRKPDLLDEHESPLADDALQAMLGGLNPEQYITRFSLTHEELVSGGQELLSGKGDLAGALFAAGLGGSQLRALLRELEQEAGEIYKARGTTLPLNAAIKEYKQATALIAEESLAGKTFSNTTSELAQARAQRQHIGAALEAAAAEHRKLTRVRENLPRVAQHKRLKAELLELGATPKTHPEDRDSRLSAQSVLETEGPRALQLIERIKRREEDISGAHIPTEVLQWGKEIAALNDELKALRAGAQRRETLSTRATQLNSQLNQLLNTVAPGQPLEAALSRRLSAHLSRRASDLAEQRQARLDALHRCRSELAEAQHTLQSTASRLLAHPEVAPSTTLKALCQALRKRGDLEAQQQQLRYERAASDRSVETALARLRPALSPGMDLTRLAVPSASTIRQFEEALRTAHDGTRELARRTCETKEKVAALHTQLQALRAAGEVPTEAELADARSARGAVWSQIRSAWVQQTPAPAEPETLAKAMEYATERADDLADRLRREASRVTTFAQLSAELAQHADALSSLEQGQQTRHQNLSQVTAQWHAAWAESGIEPLSPQEMRDWLSELEAVRRSQTDVMRLDDQLASLHDDLELARAQLLTALSSAKGPQGGSELPLAGLLDLADQHIQSLDAARLNHTQAKQQHHEAEQRAQRAELSEQQAEEAWAGWQESWSEITNALSLSPTATVGEVSGLVEGLGELSRRSEDRAATTAELQLLNEQVAQFEARVSRLAEQLKRQHTGSAEHLVEGLFNELTWGRQSQSKAEGWAEELATLREDLKVAQARCDQAHITLNQLCERAGVSEPSELPEVEARVAKARELSEQITGLEAQLVDSGLGKSLEEVIADTHVHDPESLLSQLSVLEQQREALEDQRSTIDRTIGGLTQELSAQDGRSRAAEHAQLAEDHRASIVELTQRYARNLLARQVLRREMERYRAEHQGDILRRAGALFERFTLGSFQGVHADWDDKDQPTLMGLRQGGKQIDVEGMSDGTRDQLYLALRLASVEAQVKAAEPLPLIVDDILITTDDERARAVLESLADLSARTQVLLFTHHRRVVEIAEGLGRPEQIFVHPELERRQARQG